MDHDHVKVMGLNPVYEPGVGKPLPLQPFDCQRLFEQFAAPTASSCIVCLFFHQKTSFFSIESTLCAHQPFLLRFACAHGQAACAAWLARAAPSAGLNAGVVQPGRWRPARSTPLDAGGKGPAVLGSGGWPPFVGRRGHRRLRACNRVVPAGGGAGRDAWGGYPLLHPGPPHCRWLGLRRSGSIWARKAM